MNNNLAESIDRKSIVLAEHLMFTREVLRNHRKQLSTMISDTLETNDDLLLDRLVLAAIELKVVTQSITKAIVVLENEN